MTAYRQLMLLVLEKYPYREIVAREGCSQSTIARVRRVLDAEHLVTTTQVEALTLEEIDGLFSDGRKSVAGGFVPVNIDTVVAARLGRKKPPLKVLWATYLETETPSGQRHYGYERFCQIVAEHVRVNDLTAPIQHVPGHNRLEAEARTHRNHSRELTLPNRLARCDETTGDANRISNIPDQTEFFKEMRPLCQNQQNGRTGLQSESPTACSWVPRRPSARRAGGSP